MTLLYYMLSFLSGIALTLQVGINEQLRSKIGSPILSSFISFAVGAIGLGRVFCFTLANGSYTLSGVNTIRASVGRCLWAVYLVRFIFLQQYLLLLKSDLQIYSVL